MRPGGETGPTLACPERLRTVGGAWYRVLDRAERHYRGAVCRRAAQVLQAEAPEIPQRRADPPVGHRVSLAVQRDLGIELRSHRRPQLTSDELVEPGATGPLEHPGEHVGEDRAVTERPAVLAVVAQRGEGGDRIGGQAPVHPGP